MEEGELNCPGLPAMTWGETIRDISHVAFVIIRLAISHPHGNQPLSFSTCYHCELSPICQMLEAQHSTRRTHARSFKLSLRRMSTLL